MFLTECDFIIRPLPVSTLRCAVPCPAPLRWAGPSPALLLKLTEMPCSQGYAEFLHIYIMHS